MKLKKTLSLLLAAALVVSAAAALAESNETAEEAAATAAPSETVYTLEEMLTQAMTDAYTRQATYAAYADAFADSRSIAGIDTDKQIVLLEMLLKANGVPLPASDAETTVPETVAEAYAAIYEAEKSAAMMYQAFLQQEGLPADADIIFQSVFRMIRGNTAAFAMKAQAAQRAEALQALKDSGDAQVYVIHNGGPRGTQVVYVVTNNESENNEDVIDQTETADTATEDSVSD